MKKIILWFLAIGILVFIADTLYDAGVFTSITSTREGTLEQEIPGVPGPEDVIVVPVHNMLLISSTDRRKNMAGIPTPGGIYRAPLEGDRQAQRIPHTYPDEFHPHGMSWFAYEGGEFLFVINHNRNGNFVEAFGYQNDSLIHLKSYSSELMCCPNDIAATGPASFYVTNDHGTTGGLGRMMEDYLRIPWSSVLYFDGFEFQTVRDRLSYGNGIALSNDHARLYVSATTSQDIFTFQIRDDGKLSLLDKYSLHTGPDNIDVDSDGNLWVGCHPKLLAFVKHARDSTSPSPSQVIRLTPQPKGFEEKTFFMDDGSTLSGSSVAAHWKGKVFIGAVFDPRVLVLRLNQ